MCETDYENSNLDEFPLGNIRLNRETLHQMNVGNTKYESVQLFWDFELNKVYCISFFKVFFRIV